MKFTYLLLCLFFTSWMMAQSPGGVSTNLSLWLRPDAGTNTTTNGATVTSWTNQAPSGVASSGGNGATYLSNNFNFNPGLSFNGSNQAFIFNSGNSFGVSGTQSFDVFTMLRANSVTAGRFYLSGNATDQIQLAAITSSGVRNDFGRVNKPSIVTANTTVTTNPSILGVRRTGGGSSNRLFLNGMDDGSRSDTSGIAGGNIAIGYWYAYNSGYYAGNINEVIIYGSGGLTDIADRNKVESYLAIKYGITLGNTSNVVNYTNSAGIQTWTGDATYQNNIAGIGRDEASALYQKQSQSVNTGSQVVMALGTVAATNQANANTLTDKQFFIWGDDNGSLSAFVATGNISYPRRFTRIWKTQNTESFAQDITVYYPVSVFGNVQPSTIALLYGTSAASLDNGTASTIAQNGTTTINGASYYTFTVPAAQVANMQFFSFTGLQTAPGGVSTDLQIWFKADYGVSPSTGNVTSWQNAAVNSYTVTPVSDPNIGSTYVNFNPAIHFDGNDYFTSNSNTVTTGNMFAVRVDNDGFCFGGRTTPSINNYFKFGNGSTRPVIGGYQYVFIYPFNYSTTSSIQIQRAQWRNEAFTVNGRNIGYTLTDGSLNAGSASNVDPFTDGYYIGRNNGSNYYSGNLVEIINYTSNNMSEIDLLRVNSYLAIKYGVTLSRDNNGNGTSGQTVSGSILEGDYIASDSTTRTWNSDATYQNNITGIGRDDVSALHQKVSKSVNSGATLTLATDADFTSANAAASRTDIADDLNFLIIGDDNASATTRFLSLQAQTYCTQLPNTNPAVVFGKIGISTHASQITGWPQNVPNAALVLDSSTKGFVITRITTAQRNAVGFIPVEGMLIYNTTENRFQLYKGAANGGWVNLERVCNN